MAPFSSPVKIIVTCEHGGNRIPSGYRALFSNHQKVLASHRGYDQGALHLATVLARANADFSLFSQTSRLLIDLNRSLNSPHLFSPVTQHCDAQTKEAIIAKHYFPYRTKAYHAIAHYLAQKNRVLHLSVHSFTEKLAGKIRRNEIGLLYHPQHLMEKNFCHHWKKALEIADFSVRLNYPYLGKSDGFTQHLRVQFKREKYIGIELETNQMLWKNDKNILHAINSINASFQVALENMFDKR